MASLRNQNVNLKNGQLLQDNPMKVARKPLTVFPAPENAIKKPLPMIPRLATKQASVVSVKQEPEAKRPLASITKLPTLSSLRETLPIAKRQRILQDVVRTAGKENGFLHHRERPAEVDDIYKDDIDNESLVVAYVEHIYAYLHERESKRLSASFMDGMSINPRMRAILIDWIVSVVYKFKMCQDTLFLTVDLVDRFLALPQLDVTKDELQLIGVTAMFIASKFEEVYPPELEDYVFIADNACTKPQILETEMMIANALNFDFTRPSAAHFLRRVCKAASGSTEEYCMSKYITELSLLSIEFVEILPSLVAAAAVYLTMILYGKDEDHWCSTMEYYSSYTEKEVKPIAAKLLPLVKDAPKARQQCIFKKYSSVKMLEVALKSVEMIVDAAPHFA